MNAALLYPIVIGAGVLQALGVSMNAQLRNSLSNPYLACAVSFTPILALFICLFLVLPNPLPSLTDVAKMPWWAPLGGLAGAVAVFAGLSLVDKLGSSAFNGLIITANILTCLAIDHFGLLNMPQHSLGPMRILGAVLMISGITLISRF